MTIICTCHSAPCWWQEMSFFRLGGAAESLLTVSHSNLVGLCQTCGARYVAKGVAFRQRAWPLERGKCRRSEKATFSALTFVYKCASACNFICWWQVPAQTHAVSLVSGRDQTPRPRPLNCSPWATFHRGARNSVHTCISQRRTKKSLGPLG